MYSEGSACHYHEINSPLNCNHIMQFFKNYGLINFLPSKNLSLENILSKHKNVI